MIQVNIHEAKTHLSHLIEQVQLGEEVIIAKRNQPVAKIVALPKVEKARRMGGAAAFIGPIPADFNEPLDEFQEYME